MLWKAGISEIQLPPCSNLYADDRRVVLFDRADEWHILREQQLESGDSQGNR